MRTGLFDRILTVNAPTITLDGAGNPTTTWTLFATLRAMMLSVKTGELLIRDFGEDTSILAGFRVRYLDGLLLNMQVQYNGGNFRIVAIKEIGRREYLDLMLLEVVS